MDGRQSMIKLQFVSNRTKWGRVSDCTNDMALLIEVLCEVLNESYYTDLKIDG